MRPFFESIFSFEKDSSNMALLAMEGAAELGKKVDQYLVKHLSEVYDGRRQRSYS